MYIRMISVSLQPGKIDEAISIYQNAIIPAAQIQKGYHSASLWVNRATNKAHSIGVWENEEDMKAGEESSYLHEQIARIAITFASQPVIEGYEVVAHG